MAIDTSRDLFGDPVSARVSKLVTLRVTVVTSNGYTRTHHIDIGQEEAVVTEDALVWVRRIDSSLRDKTPLVLTQPVVTYNSNDVTSVETELLGSRRLAAALNEAVAQRSVRAGW